VAGLPFMPAWRRRCTVAPIGIGPKALALALDGYMDAAGRCQVSLGRLAADLAVARRTVVRWIQELEEAGLLGVDRVAGHYCNRYQARPYGDTRDTVTVTPESPSPGHQGHRDGDSGRPLTVTPVSPELEGQKVKSSAGARAPAPEGWVPEDDEAIAEIYRQRQLDVAERAKGSSEGYGDPAQAEAALFAAAEGRKVLGAQRGTDPRP